MRILALSFGHLVVSTVASFLAFGMDLDRLRSRSALSRAAGVVHDVLWHPHDAVLRALSTDGILRPGVVPAVLVGSSLFWGIALYGLWSAARAVAGSPRVGPEPPDPEEVTLEPTPVLQHPSTQEDRHG